VVLLPRPQQYCAPLRLPLRSHPLRRDAAYRARRSQATRRLAPHGSHGWGRDGSLLFPRWLCQRSTPSTPLGSSRLQVQALHLFHGLRPSSQDSAPSWLLSEWGITTRQASLHVADRWLAPSQHGRLDPALRRPGLPERRRAATKVTWFLLRPDLHRLVIVSFQDARSAARPPGASRCSAPSSLRTPFRPHPPLNLTFGPFGHSVAPRRTPKPQGIDQSDTVASRRPRLWSPASLRSLLAPDPYLTAGPAS